MKRRDLLKQLSLVMAASAALPSIAGAASREAGAAVKMFTGRSGRLGDPDRGFVLVGGLVVPLADEPALQRDLAAVGAALGPNRRLKFATNPRNAAHYARAMAIVLGHSGVRYVGAWFDNDAIPVGSAVHAAWRQATERYVYAGPAAAQPIEIEALRHDFAVDDRVCRSLSGELGCHVTLLESANQASPLMELSGAMTKCLNAADRGVATGNRVKNGMAAATWAALGLVASTPRDMATDRLTLRRIHF